MGVQMRLNGWHRIGIVLSILWMIGGAVYERNNQREFAGKIAQFDYSNCLDKQPAPGRDCSKVIRESLEKWNKPDWGGVIYVAFAPIVAGWIVVYLFVGIFRWIRTGFRPEGKG